MPLWDEMEQGFASPEIQQRVRDMQAESAIELSNQRKERALVGEVISTVALAEARRQEEELPTTVNLCRPFSNGVAKQGRSPGFSGGGS